MPDYYVTVEKVQLWNLTIQAKTNEEAQEKAIDELDFCLPDTEFAPEILECEEVVRGVNEW